MRFSLPKTRFKELVKIVSSEPGHPEGQEDYILKWVVIIVTCAGLVMVLSASYQMYAFNIFLGQLIACAVGMVSLVIAESINPQFWKRLVKPAIILSVILMLILHLTNLGDSEFGAKRWINLGFISFQPSDVVRISLILLIATYIGDRPEIMNSLNKSLFGVLGAVLVLCAFVFFEPDLSTTVLIVFIVALMFFLGGIKLRYLLIPGLMGSGFVAWLIQDFQIKRLKDFIIQVIHPGSGDWHPHMIQSFVAFTRGGFNGIGFAQSDQSRRFLPFPFSDFIYSVIGEEFGILGSLAVLFFFFFLLYRGLQICLNQPDQFGFLLGMGLLSSIMIYGLVNMGITVGLGPVTGIPLPFWSQGGTSLVVTLWSVGVLLRLSKRTVS